MIRISFAFKYTTGYSCREEWGKGGEVGRNEMRGYGVGGSRGRQQGPTGERDLKL